MSEVTHEQVSLLLRLYEQRREPLLREARKWFSANFRVRNIEEVNRICPPGSQEHAYMRMVLGYWEMVASIVNRGLIEQDLFFENSGEQWGVWQQVKPVIAGWRTTFSNPHFLSNLEEQCSRLEAWREKRSPGSNEVMRKVFAQMSLSRPTETAQAAD